MGEQLIFEKSRSGRRAFAQAPLAASAGKIPDALRRESAPDLPQVSELQVVRHYTRLSQQNFSIDTRCASLHQVIAAELFDRYAVLPAWFMHDEIQSAGV